MTREEEIIQRALNYAEKIDYDLWLDTEHPKNYAKMLVMATAEDNAKWADEHPKNPWHDARKELPPKFIDDEGIIYNESIPVAVRVSGSKYWHMAEYYYDTKEWICEEHNTYVIRDGYGTVTHWMPIPELLEGDEK